MAEPTSAEDSDDFGGELTTNRAKEAKCGLMRLKLAGASAQASSCPEQQSPSPSGEGPTGRGDSTVATLEGAESQAGDTVSTADTPSYFPPSSDSGGEEGDAPAGENSQMLPPWKRCGQTRKAQPPFARTRDGARSEDMGAITKLQAFGEALLTETAGPGEKFKIAREIEHLIQWRACEDFGLAAEGTTNSRECDYVFRSEFGMHIGHIESTPRNMAELRDLKYAEWWTRVMTGELEGHAAVGSFSDENVPQGMDAISAK